MLARLIGAVGLVLVVAGMVGCAEFRNPVEVSTHVDGWSDPGSVDFHGNVILELGDAGKATSCESCHGADYSGGTSGVGCSSSNCHASYPHDVVFAAVSPSASHTRYISDRVNWELGTCQTCHGADYSGKGTASKNCLTCHTEVGGPEACNTCHGSAASAAPPEDLAGNVSKAIPSVGAHAAHVGQDGYTPDDVAACANCHTTQAFSASGHLDTGAPRAEVIFGSLATHDGRLSPVYDGTANTCGSTYCHGGFEFRKADSKNKWVYTKDVMRGTPVTVDWTASGSGQAVCGSCHGLPPDGHAPLPTFNCAWCHGEVVNEAGQIIDPTRHADGKIDLY